MAIRSMLCVIAAPQLIIGQAFFSGETSGEGASSVFIAANTSFVRDLTKPGNFWTAYTRGVHDRVDAFGYYGNVTILGRTQHYAGVGSSLGILKRARQKVDLAFVSFFSAPLNRRDEAATVSATFALSVSRPVKLQACDITVYSGYLHTDSLGQRANRLFSSPRSTHNAMIGAVLPVSKSASVIAEYDPGVEQQNVGVAFLYLFSGR